MLNRYYTPAAGRMHLTGVFASSMDAQAAVGRLEALGIPRSDISVVYRDQAAGGAPTTTTAAGSTVVTTDGGTRAMEGAGTGSAIGGTLGAILGAVAATATSVVVPGVGILIAGPLAGALAGAGAGGLTGGVLGALTGAGVPEEEARIYETRINQGGVVVVADVPANLEMQARDILQGRL